MVANSASRTGGAGSGAGPIVSPSPPAAPAAQTIGKPPIAKTEAPDQLEKNGAPASSLEPVANKSALAAGDPKLGRSAALLDVLLTADKASFVSKLGADKGKALADRELAKRVGLILQTTPYGAPAAVILRRLQEDPVIRERFPKLGMAELRVLQERFPQIVPRPNAPIDIGYAGGPNLEGYLDLYASVFVRSSRRGEIANAYNDASVLNPTQYFSQRYDAGKGGLDPSHFPDQNNIIGQIQNTVGALRGKGPGYLLRRAIVNAPPHWGPIEIAEEHNRFADYFAPLLYWGDKDTVDKARERARVTPDQVRELMAKFPHELGADTLAERQASFRKVIAEELGAAKAGDNLYETLGRVVQRLESEAPLVPGKKRDTYHKLPEYLTFASPPSVSAALTPEDLAKYITADPAFSAQLDTLISDRHAGLDKVLAKQIASTLGNRISRLSLREIVQVMSKKDPVYNEHLVQHLLTSFPQLFGAHKIERSRVEMNFLLATQVADAMGKMFAGATLQHVADFLKAQGADFNAVYPDFSAEDIRLLQAAYPFLPQWENKPERQLMSATGSMPLESFVRLATQQLGPGDAKKIQELIFGSFGKDIDRETVPPEIDAYLGGAYSRALMGLVARATGAERLTSWDGNSNYDLYQKFLRGDDVGMIDESVLAKVLSDKGLFNLPAERAGQIAAALMQAKNLDFVGLCDSLPSLLLGSHRAEDEVTKLSNLALGYEGLRTRLERDIFANKGLKAAFKRFARIPLRLPMIQHVVDKYKAEQPLKDQNVLMVQHMLGQAYPQIAGYKALGMKCEDAIFVGIPYQQNEEVEQAVARSFGVDVRVPPKDMQELYKAIERGVDDMVAKHKANGKDMLIVCDGPYAREYFQKKYPELLGKAHFTEQTAFGDRPEYRNNKSMHVVSYARTDLKAKKEAKFIGQAVVRAVNAVETQLRTGHEQKPILVLGLGPIGQAVAEAFAGDRASVYVYDPYMTPEMEKLAKDAGYTIVKDPKQIAAGKFMLVGCSGHLSIDEEQILSSEPNSIYVSASSKLVEINMKKLAELATDEEGRIRKVLAAEVNDQQTWHYWLKDGTIRTVIADGLPANFNDINSVPPEWIDMTMSLSLAAAVQATRGGVGYVSLNDDDQGELLALHEALVDKMHREAKEAAAAEKTAEKAAAKSPETKPDTS